jgi:hypothetical protein
MASSINALTTGSGGVVTTADNSGDLNIQSGGSTKIAVTSAGANIVGTLTVNGVAPASGKVLQVVSSNTGSKASTTSATITSLGTSAAITPSSTSSKILINIATNIGNDGNSNAAFYIVRTVGGTSTTIFTYCALITGATAAYANFPFSWIQLDSPATTSPVTYSLSGNRYDGASTPFAGGRATDTAFQMGVQFVLSEIAA